MDFDLQPTLRGDLLGLRPLHQEDWGPLFAAASDPLIWEQHPEPDRYKEEVFKEFFRVALESRGALVATDSRHGLIIGSSRFHSYAPERSEVEIGWTFLARPYWGGRYNGEMKRLMLKHAFTFVDNVIFLIGSENHRSQRAIAKVGGILSGSRFANGHESLVYRVRKHWVALAF